MRPARMTRPSAAAVSVLALTTLLATAGCRTGPAPGDIPEETSALAEVGEAYRVATIAAGRPPRKTADLLLAEGIGGNGVARIRSGEIVVRLDAALPSTAEEPGDGSATEILAYYKDVPENGGYVLMVDRTVRKLTAAEFESAPKAGKGAPPTSATKK